MNPYFAPLTTQTIERAIVTLDGNGHDARKTCRTLHKQNIKIRLSGQLRKYAYTVDKKAGTFTIYVVS